MARRGWLRAPSARQPTGGGPRPPAQRPLWLLLAVGALGWPGLRIYAGGEARAMDEEISGSEKQAGGEPPQDSANPPLHPAAHATILTIWFQARLARQTKPAWL